jgi:hypothetical protein
VKTTRLAGLVALSAVAACGARSALDAGRGDDAVASGGQGGTPAGTSAGVGGDDVPEPPCDLVSAGEPIVALRFVDRHATSPGIVGLGPSGDGSGLAIQALASGGNDPSHPEVMLARWKIGASWPGAALEEVPPSVFGIESHSYAILTRSAGGEDLAMSWYSDPGQVGRTAFRRLDLAAWQPSGPVDLSFDGGSALALVAGAGVGDFGVGHQGTGYAVAWRMNVDTGGGFVAVPMVGILDDAGQVVLGPHPMGPLIDSPGTSPAMVWSGSSYLMATSYGSCGPPQCPASIAIYRFLPATGDAFDDSTIELVWFFDVDGVARRPELAVHEGRVWLAYFAGEEDAPQRLWLAPLDLEGEALGDPVMVEEDLEPLGGLRMTSAPFGVVLGWPEDGDVALEDAELGRSQMQLRHFDADGALASAPITLSTRRIANTGLGSLAALAQPRGLAVTWSGSDDDPSDGHDVAHLALTRCQ